MEIIIRRTILLTMEAPYGFESLYDSSGAFRGGGRARGYAPRQIEEERRKSQYFPLR